MQSTQLQRGDAKASIWVALLAFALAAFALGTGQAGSTALVAMTCGLRCIHAPTPGARRGRRPPGLERRARRAHELLARGAHRQALRVSHDVAERAQSARLQRAALELAAWCELGLGRPQAARDALSWLGGARAVDPYCAAAVEDACGQSLWALHIVERAAKRQPLSREATLFRIDLLARVRGLDAACSLTLQQLARLRREDAELVLAAAERSWPGRPAVRALADALKKPAAPAFVDKSPRFRGAVALSAASGDSARRAAAKPRDATPFSEEADHARE